MFHNTMNRTKSSKAWETTEKGNKATRWRLRKKHMRILHCVHIQQQLATGLPWQNTNLSK